MTSPYLTAQEAIAILGVQANTLYAYVSRGLIRSEVFEGKGHRYCAEDIENLRKRKQYRKDPVKLVESALHFGTPLLESSITLIESGQFYYRGYNAVELAQSASLEEVALLLWSGLWVDQAREKYFETPLVLPKLLPPLDLEKFWKNLSAIELFQVVLPLVAAEDLSAYDIRKNTVIAKGAFLLKLMVALAARKLPFSGSFQGLASLLQESWIPERKDASALLNSALILCADHELNVSSFTARCVASGDSTPYSVVLAGLAAFQGAQHGWYSERVEALFREVENPLEAPKYLALRLKRGEALPGFHHPLYPQGDPRGRALMELTQKYFPDSPELAKAQAIAQAGFQLVQHYPTIDFGLVTLVRTLQLPSATAMTLFALGRTIGWIGHALEQYEQKKLIRPRARYIGERPRPFPKP
jgi:citrate synthase